MTLTLLANSELLILASRAMTFGEVFTPTRVAYIAGGLTTLLLFWLGYSLLEKFRGWDQEHQKTNEGLFDQLCQAHQLSRGEKKLLADLNGLLPPEQWPLVFVDPSILMAQCRAGHRLSEHAELGEKLFGDHFNG
jgi:hypothetical protein